MFHKNMGSQLNITVIHIAAIIVLLSTVVSCGYHFQGSGSMLPEDIKTVAIAPVDNKTTETDLGIRFAGALRDRFDRYGVVKVVDDIENADAILETSIEKIDKIATSVTGKTDLELASDTSITVSAELRANDGRVFYKNPQLSLSGAYAAVNSAVSTSSSAFAQSGVGLQTLSALGSRELSRGEQNRVFDEILEELARRIYLCSVAPSF